MEILWMRRAWGDILIWLFLKAHRSSVAERAVVLRLIVLNSRESKSSAVSWDYVVQVRTRLS